MTRGGRSRAGSLGRPASGYLAVVTLAAVAAAGAALTGVGDLGAGDLGGFAALAALAAAAQLFVVPTGRNHGFHTAIVFAVAAALVAPAALVAFLGLAQHGPEGIRKRYPWYIQLFNVASGTLFALAAWSTAQAVLAVAPDGGDGTFALAGLAAAAVLVLLNRALLAGMLALARGHTFRSSGLFAVASLAMDMVLAGLGVVLALVWRTNPWLVPAVVAPLLMVHRTFSLLAALRESEERFRAMFESAPVGAALIDLDGRIAACNPSLSAMLAAQPRQLVGAERTAFLHPDDAAADEQPFRELAAGERERYAGERRYVTVDGRLVWADVAVALARSNDGKPRFAIATVQDTTERRQLEDQLRQAQKLEAIGRLAGGIAHDFNNMLTAITGYGHMALISLEAGRPVDRGDLEEVVRAADRAGALTGQLLAFSRKQVLQPRVLSVNDVVAQLDKLLGLLAGERIRVTTSFDSELGLVRADPGQLEQAVVNLVVNARDAMPAGGDLRLETANVEIERPGADVPAGRYVCMTVTDTGHGMDAETQARMFEPFFTTKPPGEGTGLGLATVHGVISQSGGHVRVESVLGAGTSCRIYLPRIVEEQPLEESGANPAQSASGSETILVVEDEDVVRALIRDTLTVNGYSVLEARDGVEALELCEARDGIDAVVTDVVMPRLGGPELVRRLAEQQSNARVLFVSGYTDGALAANGDLDGASFLQKPFTPDGLARKLRDVLDGVAA